MGFLNDSKPQSIYLEVRKEGDLVRPLAAKPQSIWTHKIHEVSTMGPDNQPIVLRRFAYETCTSTGRGNAGCYLCNTPDPMWHKLGSQEQTNRQGKRVDFPKAPIHILPVFNHSTQDVVVMKGGNQIFEEMDKWFDTQPEANQDLRRCDWNISKEGEKKRTKYKSVRMDATAFQINEALLEKAKSVMAQALADRNPTDPNKLAAMIRGESGAPALAEGATVPVQAALPGYGPQPTQALPPNTFQVNTVGGFTGIGGVAGATTQLPQQAWQTPPVQQQFSPPPPVVQQSAPKPQVVAGPGQAANRNLVDEFSSWVSQQPEFLGMGAVTTFIPALKEAIGHVDYYKLTEEQLSNLKVALNTKLAAMRTARG